MSATVAWSVPSGALPVDLDDVNSARSLAVLSVPPCSTVLYVGSGTGAVARALAARGCHVWGIDIDSDATRLTKPWCDGFLLGDVETADLDAFLGAHRVDAILLLDVLEYLRDPAAAIRRLVPLLAPRGRIILSVTHVAHAAVRLQLLAGALPRSSRGPSDHTLLHFFDRSSLGDLLRHAGVRVIDEARVVRSVEETEIAVDLAAFPREAIDRATAGPDADTYQFVVTVAPGAVGPTVEHMPGLVSTLTEHLHRAEQNCRQLQERVRDLETEAVAAVTEDCRRLELEHRQSEEQLAKTTTELARCQVERRFLRDDVLVKDAYLATLRQQVSQSEQAHEDLRAARERLDDLTAEHATEAKRAADLAVSNREVHRQLERAQHELHQLHVSVADTLAQPRYVLADRCNAWARKVGFLHTALKRVWTARLRGRR
jgi:2-polyprenyl-3-methyl-5-hydroxy-6-metoxy-1,4-benzoquinol methylase